MKSLDNLIQLFTKRKSRADTALAPEDFPLAADGSRLLNSEGKSVALVKDSVTAADIAERLNEDADRKEEDKWSA